MKTASRLTILFGLTSVIVACVSCASPEKRAQQDADYRARFERLSSIRMTEAGAGHVDETQQQFLPSAKVELSTQYIDRNLPGQTPVPSAGGFAHCVASFQCPTALGRYLVVLDCPDLPNMDKLKTYPFSVVATLPLKE